MHTITIYPPTSLKEYIQPIPGDRYGMQRLLYNGQHNYLLPYTEPQSIPPMEIRNSLLRLQERLPLGGLGEYEVLLLNAQIMEALDPASAMVDGQRFPGFIVLSGRIDASHEDILSHELTHELLRTYVNQLEEQEFFNLIDQLRGSELDPEWEKRPQERMAEYVSAAIWGEPVNEGMPPLSAPVLERVKEWAQKQFGSQEKARVVIDEQRVITLQIGNIHAIVDGEEVLMDVAPVLVKDRTLASVRFICETLGYQVEWDEKSRTVSIHR
ncbi:MAG: copper amine oxidase N-terminal domain-containing protein [Mycobacterium leprae]